MSQLDRKIIETYREVRRKEKVRKHMSHLENKLVEYAKRIERMDKELHELGYNLKWMEFAPLQKIKEWLWGDEPLEEESDQMRSRYFKRFMQYKALLKEKELCEYEHSVLATQEKKIQDLEGPLKKLIREKEEELVTENREIAYDILAIRENIIFLKLLIEEMDEALEYGEKAIKVLEAMIEDLKSVKSMDRMEMYGQGRYSSMSKLAYIEKAQRDIDMAYNWLQRFNLELRDISVEQKVDYFDEMHQYEKFIDALYYALLNSSLIHEAIDDSIGKLSLVCKSVQHNLKQLHQDIELSERSIKRQSYKIELLIIQISRSDLQSDEE